MTRQQKFETEKQTHGDKEKREEASDLKVNDLSLLMLITIAILT